MTAPTWIYAVTAGEGGSIKIGRSTNPKRRLRELQTGSSKLLILVAMEPGDAQLERELHEQLEPWRIDGCREWYQPAAITAVRAILGDQQLPLFAESEPPADRAGRRRRRGVTSGA